MESESFFQITPESAALDNDGQSSLRKNKVGQFRGHKSWMEKALSQADSLVNKIMC